MFFQVGITVLPWNHLCDPRYIFVGVYFCMLVVVAKMAHAKKVKAIESLGEIKAPAGFFWWMYTAIPQQIS